MNRLNDRRVREDFVSVRVNAGMLSMHVRPLSFAEYLIPFNVNVDLSAGVNEA